MTLKECYQILGLSQTASLEEVKRVYRRRAFELHPDLNPGLADASRQFQKLNEAYVILSKLISVREERENKKKPFFGSTGQTRQTSADANSATSSANQRPSGQSETTDKHASATSGASSSASSASASSASSGDNEKRNEAKGQTTSTSHSGATTSEPGGASATGTAESSSKGQTEQTSTSSSTDSTREPADGDSRKRHNLHDTMYTEQQEVLQDILSDPFARRVFEDIYSEIRKKVPQAPSPSSPAPIRRKKAVPSALSGLLNWGQRSIHLDFSKGIGGALKGWLRNQIDEEQLFELPAKRLIPGARIRLQIRHGFSDEVTTLDVTLPPDFKPEKPIRLKGMGKKLGHWQGDLYLRFSAKS